MIPLQIYRHEKFGGLNTKYPDTSLKPYEAEVCHNLYFEGGALVKRQGTKTRATLSGIIRNLYNYKNSTGADKLIAADDSGSAVTLKDSAGATVDNNGGSGFTTAKRFSIVTYNDLMIYCNNTDGIRKYDGTTAAALGGSPPTTCLAIGVHNNFVLLGNYVTGGVRERNRVAYSALGDPENYTLASNFLNFRLDDGDEIVAIKPFTEEISVVFKKRSIWALTGFSVSTFTVKMIWDGIGAANQWTIDTLPTPFGRTMIFLSSEGRVYLLPLSAFTLSVSETAPIYASETIQDQLSYHGLEPVSTDTIADRSMSCAFFSNQEWHLGLPSKFSTGEADLWFRYDYNRSNPREEDYWWNTERSEGNGAFRVAYSMATTRDVGTTAALSFATGADGTSLLADFDAVSVSQTTGNGTGIVNGGFQAGSVHHKQLVQTFTTPTYGTFLDQVTLRLKRAVDVIAGTVGGLCEVMVIQWNGSTFTGTQSAPVLFDSSALTFGTTFANYIFHVRDLNDNTKPYYLAPNATYGIFLIMHGDILRDRVYWDVATGNPYSGGQAYKGTVPNPADAITYTAITNNDFYFTASGYRMLVPVQKVTATSTQTVKSIGLQLFRNAGPDIPLNVFLYSHTAGSCAQGNPNAKVALALAQNIQTGSVTADGRWYTFPLGTDYEITNGTDYWIVPLYVPSYATSTLNGPASATPPDKTQFKWVINTGGGGNGNKGKWAGTVNNDPTTFSTWTCALAGDSHYYQLNFEGPLQIETLITGSTGGSIINHNVTYGDGGTFIRANYETAWLDFGYPEAFKALRYMTVFLETAGAGGIRVSIFSAYDSSFGNVAEDTIDLDLTDQFQASRGFRFRCIGHGRFFKFKFHDELLSTASKWKLLKFVTEYQIKTGKRRAGAVSFPAGGSGGSEGGS